MPAAVVLCLFVAPIHAVVVSTCSARPTWNVAGLSMCAAPTLTAWADVLPISEAQRLTDAAAAKTVLTVCGEGTLCSRMPLAETEGVGFTSHVNFVLDDDGLPVFPLADSQAAANLRATAEGDGSSPVSFFAHASSSGVTLLGRAEAYDMTQLDGYRLNLAKDRTGLSEEALASRTWHRLVPQRVHYTDPVRGTEEWVAANEFVTATANPLASVSPELLTRLAAKQADLRRAATLLFELPPGRVEACAVIGVDQLGFDLRVVTAGGAPEGAVRRVGFRQPPQNMEEALSLFVKLFQEAYEREQGWLE